jgi:hypothetical protein
MFGNKAFLTIALMAVVATVVIIAMIMMPIVTTKYTIQRYLEVEYKYNNAEMVMLELLSYPEIRHGLGVYASGLDKNLNAADGPFDTEAFPKDVSGVLDKLVPDGGCYALYYDALPYSTDDSGWTTIVKRDNDASGAVCNVADLGSVGKAFLPMPQGNPQVMLILKTL